MRRKKNRISLWFISAIGLIALLVIAQKLYNRYIYSHSDANLTAVERTWLNYSDDVKEVSKKLQLSPEYLLALIAIESSGIKDVPSRYEKHIFLKLKKVRDAEIANFGGINTQDIFGSSDDALKNLASSWGPYQLMGYQCLYLNIKLKEMRGKKSVYYGAKWIKDAYGKYLDDKKFKDAFHLHNTGKPYPKIGPPRTHSRYYVPKGLKFMKEFKVLLDKEIITER